MRSIVLMLWLAAVNVAGVGVMRAAQVGGFCGESSGVGKASNAEMLPCAARASGLWTKDYAQIKAQIIVQRDSMAALYSNAGTTKRAELIAAARKLVLKTILDDLFPAWLGTPWDFNGITQKPREGQIACGYFVTTVMRDAGFGVERAKLAQQASLKIIKTLCPADAIKDYGGIDVPELVRRMGTLPKGLYIVGLDIHTGFIYNGVKSVGFIHASYGDPSEVVHEVALKSNVLAQSKRFVLGRVDTDVLLGKWLSKAAIPTI